MYTIAQICKRNSWIIKSFKNLLFYTSFTSIKDCRDFSQSWAKFMDFVHFAKKNSRGLLARFNTILMRGKIEEFSPLENISKTNLIFLKEKEYFGHPFWFHFTWDILWSHYPQCQWPCCIDPFWKVSVD